jgi:hypothetical protein
MKASAIGRWVIGRRSLFTVESPRERQEILDRADAQLASAGDEDNAMSSWTRPAGHVESDWDDEQLLLRVRKRGTGTAALSTVRVRFEPNATGHGTLLHIDARYGTFTTVAYLAFLVISVVLVALGWFFGLILLVAAIMAMFTARSREKGDLKTLYDFVADAALDDEEPGE